MTLTSDYVYRGFSKSDEDPALQVGVELEHDSGFFGGVAGSTVDFGSKDTNGSVADREMYFFLGLGSELADNWRLDGILSRYSYNGDVFGRDFDYNEVQGAINFRELLTASASYSPDIYGSGEQALSYEMTGRYLVRDWAYVSGRIGYQDVDSLYGVDYLDWNFGFSLYFKHLLVDLRYFDVDDDGRYIFGERAADNRLVFSLTLGGILEWP